jgi:hypothetical protein
MPLPWLNHDDHCVSSKKRSPKIQPRFSRYNQIGNRNPRRNKPRDFLFPIGILDQERNNPLGCARIFCIFRKMYASNQRTFVRKEYPALTGCGLSIPIAKARGFPPDLGKNWSSVTIRTAIAQVTINPMITVVRDKCPKTLDQSRSKAEAYIGCRMT